MGAGVPGEAVIEASCLPLLLLCAGEGREDKYAGEKHGLAATQPFRASPVPATPSAPSSPLALPAILPIHLRAAMDAFFDIANPVPAEETEQVPRDYDTGSGTSSGSCTIA